MSGLSRFSLKNSVAVIILCVLVLGYGLYSTTQIKQQTFPDVSFPAVFVQAVYPGGTTEEVETEVTNPVEASLQGLKGYTGLTSTSAENSASIFIQYPFGTNMENITKDVESAIAKLSLPDKAKVTVQRLSAGSQPIYQAAIFSSGDSSEDIQKTLEEQVVPKLQKADGVSSVTLKGTKSEELRIVVDKAKANQYGLSLSAIQSALQSLDYALPLGSVNQDDATIPLSLVGKVNNIQQIKDLEMQAGSGQRAQGGGAGGKQAEDNAAVSSPQKVKLSDIASIETVSTQNEMTRFNGKPSYVVQVTKNQDANTAEVATEVKDILASYQASSNLDVHVIDDQGAAIEESVSSLIREGLFGALFCVVIIFLFLRNIRATLISILALPISIFTTIALLNQMGYTLNIMTLGGIAVSIGRIVDDSIVVIENIFRWRQEKGTEMKGKELAYRATKEVIGAVSSSTFATVVVFLPLAFVSGIIGEFFRPFAISVVISILASLLVAMMLIPVLGAKFFNRIKPHKEGGKLIDAYEKLIRGALKRKGLVLVLSVVILIGSLGTIPLLGVTFLPAGSVPSVQINMTLPAQSAIAQTNALSEKVEGYLKDLKDVDNYQVSIGGGGSGRPMQQTGSAANKAVFNVQFKEKTDMDSVYENTTKDLQALVDETVPGTTINVKEGEQDGPPSGNNVDISLYASNVTALAEASNQVEKLLGQNSDLKDITNNLKDVTPKWVLSINQAGRDANVSSYQIMQVVNEQLRPMTVGTFTIDNKSQAITMAYQQQISSKEQLENIDIQTAAGMKKLKDIVDVSQADAAVSVNHDDGKTYAKISATVKGNVAIVTKAVTADMQSLTLPSGVDYKIGGGNEMLNSGFSSMGIAMGAAIGLVFLVLSMTFGGIRTPLIVLSSLLFVPVGALGGLLVAGQALSMSSMIGMLMLVGIVVTNAVVLLDRVEHNLKAGVPLTEALVEASKTRLRPILMTACATILALVPLAFSESSNSLISKGLAITVIGGLTTSTLLTLIVVPVIYQMTGKNRKMEVDEF